MKSNNNLIFNIIGVLATYFYIITFNIVILWFYYTCLIITLKVLKCFFYFVNCYYIDSSDWYEQNIL